MSALGIGSTLFSLFNNTSTTPTVAQKSSVTTSQASDFSSSLTLQMASMRAQTVNSLIGSAFSDSQNNTSSALNAINETSSGSSDSLSQLGLSNNIQGLSSSGRKLSLFDPESAYSMMSVINNQDAIYKAQYSELSAMKTAVSGMQQAGTTLAGTDATMSNEAITSRLQDFANKYNEWSTRFEGTVKSDGVLAGTQAAEISLYELEQSVENPFNGAKDGIHGLKDLGFTIDPATNLASLDTTKLNAMLSSNKQAAVDAIDTFSANFAKSAELLISPNNFIPNRLANLDKVIAYVDKNETSLQAEFGLGDPAKPTANVAKALAAYNQTYRL